MGSQTSEGKTVYTWWAEWIPSAGGQAWVNNKRQEAKCFVNGMITQWGLEALRSGEGVVDIGGDPGFLAEALIRAGIHVTVVDPGFAQSGKADGATVSFINAPARSQQVRSGTVPFRLIREPFNDAFVKKHAKFLQGISAMVSLYPDEVT